MFFIRNKKHELSLREIHTYHNFKRERKKKKQREMTFIHAVAAEVVKRLVLTTSASARGTEEDWFLRNKKHSLSLREIYTYHKFKRRRKKGKKKREEKTFIHAVAAEAVKRLVLTGSASARGTEEDCF